MAPSAATALVERWDELRPWPEVSDVLDRLGGPVRLAVVTNCSDVLGRRAAGSIGRPFDLVVTSERAGWYKPRPEPYQLALRELALPAAQVLFVAGSPADIGGAGAVGMPVFWHNRIGLPIPAGPEASRRHLVGTGSSLQPLIPLVLGASSGTG